MTTWITSDTHFSHWTSEERNIIKYCSRPFQTVAEMDSELIKRWNAVVRPNQTVYHLGDFTLASAPIAYSILSQLHGKIMLVPGGHDYFLKSHSELPQTVGEFAQIPRNLTVLPPIHTFKFQKKLITLCHFPLRSWHGSYYNAIHFYGHWHSDEIPPLPNSLNVCCDLHNFQPIKLEDAVEMAQNVKGE